MIDLPEQLRIALNRPPAEVVKLIDPLTQVQYVLITQEEYIRLYGVSRAHLPESNQVESQFEFDPIVRIREVFIVLGDVRIIPDAPDFAVSEHGDIFRIHRDGSVNRRKTTVYPDGYVHYKIERPDGTAKGGTLSCNGSA